MSSYSKAASKAASKASSVSKSKTRSTVGVNDTFNRGLVIHHLVFSWAATLGCTEYDRLHLPPYLDSPQFDAVIDDIVLHSQAIGDSLKVIVPGGKHDYFKAESHPLQEVTTKLFGSGSGPDLATAIRERFQQDMLGMGLAKLRQYRLKPLLLRRKASQGPKADKAGPGQVGQVDLGDLYLSAIEFSDEDEGSSADHLVVELRRPPAAAAESSQEIELPPWTWVLNWAANKNPYTRRTRASRSASQKPPCPTPSSTSSSSSASQRTRSSASGPTALESPHSSAASPSSSRLPPHTPAATTTLAPAIKRAPSPDGSHAIQPKRKKLLTRPQVASVSPPPLLAVPPAVASDSSRPPTLSKPTTSTSTSSAPIGSPPSPPARPRLAASDSSRPPTLPKTATAPESSPSPPPPDSSSQSRTSPGSRAPPSMFMELDDGDLELMPLATRRAEPGEARGRKATRPASIETPTTVRASTSSTLKQQASAGRQTDLTRPNSTSTSIAASSSAAPKRSPTLPSSTARSSSSPTRTLSNAHQHPPAPTTALVTPAPVSPGKLVTPHDTCGTPHDTFVPPLAPASAARAPSPPPAPRVPLAPNAAPATSTNHDPPAPRAPYATPPIPPAEAIRRIHVKAMHMYFGIVAFCDLRETLTDDDVSFGLVVNVTRAIPAPLATKGLVGKVVDAARLLAPALEPMPLADIVPLAVESVSLVAAYPWATHAWIVAVVRAAQAVLGNDVQVDASALRRYAEVTAGHVAGGVAAGEVQETVAVEMAVSVVVHDAIVRDGHRVQLEHVVEFVKVWQELGMTVTKEAVVEGVSVVSAGV